MVTACGAGCVFANASAQTTAPTGPAADSSFALEEVVVTARKREENLQSVPISITAISGKELQERGLQDVGALTNSTPNLEINNGRPDGGGSTAQITIRGVGQNDFLIPNDPGVGLYVDDVYVARSSGGISGLVDIQSIEVLRGPQGTLYGKDTIGGAVRITTKKPSLDGSTEEMGITLGTFGRFDFNASANLPVSDVFALRITGSSRNTNDIGHRVLDPSGRGTGNIDEQELRLAGLYKPSDDLTILISGDYTRTRQHGPYGADSHYFGNALIDALNTYYYPTINASLGLPAGSIFDSRWVSSPSTDYGTGPNQEDFDTWGLSGVVTYDINSHFNLKSITAYRHTRSIAGRDGDFSPYPVVETVNTDWSGQFSEELQLNGSFERFKWTNGLYFIDEDLKNTYNTQLWHGLVDTPVNIDFDAQSLSTLRQKSFSVYGQGTYDLTNRLHLTVGGRYNRESKDFNTRWYFLVQPRAYTCPGIDVSGHYDNCKNTDNVFTPMGTLAFDINQDVMAYASFSEGFKAGGWTPRLFSQTSLERNNPERLKAYEVGVKSEWFDRRLILNADFFYSDYRDLQLTEVLADAQGNPQPVVLNAGKARITGFEMDATAKLTRTTTLQLAVGTLDGKYTQLDPGVLQSIHLDYKLPDTPPVTVNLSLQQDIFLPANAGLINARLDANYKGKTYKEPDNSPYLVQDPYTLINARVSYKPAKGKWEVGAFGTNITNKQYLTSGLDLHTTFGFVESYYGRPREAGVDFKVHFE
jgi:iron complex outermembrane receptor protein